VRTDPQRLSPFAWVASLLTAVFWTSNTMAAAIPAKAEAESLSLSATTGAGVNFFTESYAKISVDLLWPIHPRLGLGAVISYKGNSLFCALETSGRLSTTLHLHRLRIHVAVEVGHIAFYTRRLDNTDYWASLSGSYEGVVAWQESRSLWVSGLVLGHSIELLYPLSQHLSLRITPLAVSAYWNTMWWGAWEPTLGFGYQF
jgi:hypothetical protein